MSPSVSASGQSLYENAVCRMRGTLNKSSPSAKKKMTSRAIFPAQQHKHVPHGNERYKRVARFVVTRGDSTKMLQMREKSLDVIAQYIGALIERALNFSMFPGRDHGNDTGQPQAIDERIAIVGTVGNQQITALWHERVRDLNVRHVSWRDRPVKHVVKNIDHHMQFGGATPARFTNSPLCGGARGSRCVLMNPDVRAVYGGNSSACLAGIGHGVKPLP